jgi:hypothetical protein
MTFQSNGWGGPVMDLATFISTHGSELIEMISVQTDSGWGGFDGYLDGLEVSLTNGKLGRVNFGHIPTCGNGIVDVGDGEECDSAISGSDCCTAECLFVSSSTECRASTGDCDVAESCTGSSAACPADALASSSTECRASADACDVAETCTGTSDTCPADGFASSSTQCRASAGSCDVAETCTGSSSTCPSNGFASSSTVCRSSAGVCDISETCTGSSAACPANAKSTGVCRLASADCDAAEFCDGSNDDCPADQLSAPGSACTDDGDICTDDECDGAGTCVHTLDEGNDPSCVVTTTTTTTTSTTTTTLPELCGLQPTIGCKLAAPGKSKVQIKLKGGSSDQFKWKFNRGDATSVTDFLDPVGSLPTTHVCVWDAFGKVMEMDLLPGGTCAGKPCWKASGTKGYKYKDKAAIPDGLTTVKQKAGANGKSKVLAKGKGSNLPSPVLPLVLPVTVEMIADDGSATNCWQNTFTTAIKNDATQLKAKGP